MGIRIKLLALILGVAFLYFVLKALKNNVMRPSNSVLWVAISIFLVSVPLLEPFYKWLAVNIVGINDARHIIYIALIGFLVIYTFYLTRVISRLSDQVQRLLGMTAILETQIANIGADSESSCSDSSKGRSSSE